MAIEFDAAAGMFREIGVHLTQDAFDKLSRYAELLLAESDRQNVTAVRTEPEIWTRHFLDAAYLLRYLKSGTVIDIGTGGGIPAIPLAILEPALRVTMLDSELRKIEFCREAVKVLELDAQAICGRAEELARDNAYAEQFDFVVSRAMANGSMLTELAVPFLKTGGMLLAMKGRQYDPEIERFAPAADTLLCTLEEPLTYELCGERKHLILLRKNAPTPPQYPRRFAKIKRAPL